MHFLLSLCFLIHDASALDRRAPAGIAITNNVLELTSLPHPHPLVPPSSKHLARRRTELASRQINQNLLTIGGRVYMVNATIGGQTFTLVIDTGSADTWVASSSFRCVDPYAYSDDTDVDCGFGALYDGLERRSFSPIGYPFAVNYSGGEFLWGSMGLEEFSFISSQQAIRVQQMIGVVTSGFWIGDSISSGLIGLGFTSLARGINSQDLNYTSALYTIFNSTSLPPLFSLALHRPNTTHPRAGGTLALGGIPSIPHDNRWTRVPIQPLVQGLYAWYQIPVDGFAIIPPPTSTSHSRNPDPPNPYKEYRVSMIIDSGTSLVYVPDAVAGHVANAFVPPARWDGEAGMWRLSCGAQAPRVGIRLGGETYWMSEGDLMSKNKGGDDGGRDECVLAVQGAQGGSFVLGDSWLKNVLVVFDVGDAMYGGANAGNRDGDGAGSVRVVGREVY